MNWLMDNLGTLVVAAILLVMVSAILTGMVRRHRAGQGGCACGCGGCPGAGMCRGVQKK